MRYLVTAPASTANLGPGFDCVAAALTLDLSVIADDEADEARIDVIGEGAQAIPTDGSNLLVRAAEVVHGPLPPLHLRVRNHIPMGRGLGSSAAAIAAGVVLGTALSGRKPEPEEMLAAACSLEPHPDNLAACLYGGLVVAAPSGGGTSVIRMDPARHIRPVLLVPEEHELGTEQARSVLPQQVARPDAVSNVAWTAGLVALLTGRTSADPRELLTCTQDRLHQDARAPLMPETARLLQRLREAGVAACVSGAGPSLVCLVTGSGEDVVREVAEELAGWRLVVADWESRGARVETIDGRLV
ncbi:MAG TPA: homoserine kinase [Actinomycetota bacterium]|nr:homoserine kinase [Actinomycetota bacterium]